MPTIRYESHETEKAFRLIAKNKADAIRKEMVEKAVADYRIAVTARLAEVVIELADRMDDIGHTRQMEIIVRDGGEK